ncbi:hypothetical protein ACFQZO_23525 [Bradyrhizobium sp. GCM10027634]|uniref:hypothetical protein n=1 Tax=unclassified Bradyrhizobium TaxID=2631580 RepID=UPI00263A693E|nr:hypothetical protein [Bradyrhizobium sp. WYCCWR 12677]MDN5003811.1 hypothetical protein [Bradyrhizobium sp. WYCCWR 12677]
MMGFSAAGGAMMGMGGFGLGSSLAQQVQNETEEERKRREQQQAAQRAGLSPAGRALAYGGAMLSF